MVRGPPAEIERVLAAHPAVAMVAVGPVKDEIKGELACAYVVRREGAEVTAAELITPGTASPRTSGRVRWSSWLRCPQPLRGRSCAASSPTPVL